MRTSPSKDLYQRVTDRVVAALEAGTLPWRKGWKDGNSAAHGFPHNATTGRAYRGINVWLLMMEAEELGYQSTGWLTPKQALALKLDFKGEKTTEVVFWSRSTRQVEGEDKPRTFMWAKSYRVLNVDQCKGDKSKLKGVDSLRMPEEISTPDELCNAIAQALEVSIKHGGDRACYVPSRDMIMLPPQDSFESDDEYRATLLHESTHSTGHKSRCDRDLKNSFGSEGYAWEELVAELGCTYIGAALDMPMDIPNHASYLANWLKVLKGNPKALMQAASAAQRAVDYLFDKLDIAEIPEYQRDERKSTKLTPTAEDLGIAA